MKPIVISAEIVLTVATNLMAIVVIARYPELREDRTTLFMLSLCVSDLAIGCTVLPISDVLCSHAAPALQRAARALAKAHLFFVWWFGFNSLHCLGWVAATKALALIRPLHHEQLLSYRRCYVIIGSTWLIGGALAAAKFTTGATWVAQLCMHIVPTDSDGVLGFVVLTYVVSVIVPGAVHVFATARIFAVVLRTHNRITAQVQAVDTGDSQLVTLKAIRSARSVLVICFVAIALRIPISLLVLLRPDVRAQPPLKAVLGFGALWLFNCNWFLNSLLYLTLYRSVRQKVKLMFVDLYTFVRRA